MKKYIINPVTGKEEILKPSPDRTEMLERNVKELQEQLNHCQKRIMELNNQLDKERSGNRVLEEEIRKALEIPDTI